jgi:hypothetical protein
MTNSSKSLGVKNRKLSRKKSKRRVKEEIDGPPSDCKVISTRMLFRDQSATQVVEVEEID